MNLILQKSNEGFLLRIMIERMFAKAIFSAEHEFGRIFRVVLRYGIAIGKYRVGQK